MVDTQKTKPNYHCAARDHVEEVVTEDVYTSSY